MKKKFFAILSAALLLGSISASPVLAAESGSARNVSYCYDYNTENLSDSSDDDWYCGRGRGCRGGYGGGYGCGRHGGCYYGD